MVASVWCSSWIATPSFASTAWCRASLHRRPSLLRPGESSPIFTPPSCPTESATRFVDQDRVDLVDDRIRMAALDDAVEADRHVVAEVVEAELGVGAVCDVRGVGLLARLERHHRLDERDAHPEPFVDAAVPFRVALGEVVVHGHEMDAVAFERIQIEGQARDERLPLAGLHLGDVALVEDDAA